MARHLGALGLQTSDLGLGCMGFSQGYGPTDDALSVRTIQSSIDAGVTLMDTAQSYGAGHNEMLIGSVLAQISERRKELQIATKFGITRDASGVHLDARPDHIAGFCDASLQRLGTDVIDLYYLHRVDPAVDLQETVGAMGELVKAGKVRCLGVSEVTAEQLATAHAVHPIAAVQFEWSLLWREPERSIVPAARQLGVGLVPYSPMGRGLLSGMLATDAEVGASVFRKSDPRFMGAALERNRRQVDALRQYAAQRGVSPAQLALAWLLAQGPDVVPISGTRRPERALENWKSVEVEMSAEDLRELDQAVPPENWAGDRNSFAVPNSERPKSS